MNLTTFIQQALTEDIGPGDITTEACVPPESAGRATIRAKQELVVCGQHVAPLVFRAVAARYGGEVRYTPLVEDGEAVSSGTLVAHVEGPLRVLLIGERITLNLMMKLSGIATNVRNWVDAAGDDGPRIVDTRKTTPLLRGLEKYAVRCGGGHNHRMGLYDGAMVKDNHIAAVGSIGAAVAAVRSNSHHLVKVEVEVSNLAQLEAALDARVDVILLDNMTNEQLSESIGIARARSPAVVLEASGNMDPERIRQIRHLDLDVISAGGLIHQATWVDLSMKITEVSS